MEKDNIDNNGDYNVKDITENNDNVTSTNKKPNVNPKIIGIIIGGIIIAALIVYGAIALFSGDDSLKSTAIVSVSGDVKKEIEMTNFDGFDTVSISLEDGKYTAVSISDIINKVKPLGEEISIYMFAPDGVGAEILLDEIEDDSMLYFSEETGWTFNSPMHPVQSGIKGISNIVVVAGERTEETPGVSLIIDDKDDFISCGNLFVTNKEKIIALEGEPELNGKMTNAYTSRDLLQIATLLNGKENDVVAYFGDGSQEKISAEGYLLWRGNTVDYIDTDGKSITKDITGIWANAPELSVADIRDKVESEDGDVLIIEVDGLGMETFEEYKPEYIYNKDYETIRTVLPSISNVALASIVSGETPDVTGVSEREDRILEVGDMFEGKDAIVVEGYSQLITMSLEQQLNADQNGDGSTDDEVFAAAKEAIEEKHELAYIHFHGYDDVCHTYGPTSNEAKDKLIELDGYIKTLSESFSGTVYIVSDHGQHENPDGDKLGEHGDFRYSDMAVPLIIYQV